MALHHRLADERRLIAASTVFGIAVTTVAVLAVVSSSGTCACTDPPPKFVFEESDNGTTVVVTSNRGDFRVDTLSVAVDGNTTAWTAHGNASGRLGNDTAVVTGDRYVVRSVEQGDEIHVLWTPRNKNESQVMSTYVVGTNGTTTQN